MVSFWIKSNGKKYNLDDAEVGNPGIGGTQFELAIIPYMLSKMYNSYDINIYTDNLALESKELKIHYVNNFLEVIDEVSKTESILVFAHGQTDSLFYEYLNQTNIKAIGWVHNYLTFPHYIWLKESKNVKKIVFVGRQLYDHYIDTSLIEKATYIYNCIPNYKTIKRKIDKEHPKVIFIGALIKQKGFHVLAKAWKKILDECPTAQLYIMGEGLYGDEKVTNRYIKYCKKFLVDNKGNLLESVHFLGTLGTEKQIYYEMASVGVANPIGKTETFCLSAVEFEAHEIPVVTFDGFGLLDTVVNGETGIRVRGVDELAKAIIRLIQDMEFNKVLGENGRNFVCSLFTPEHVIPKWHWLITEGLYLEEMPDEFSYAHYMDDWKWLRYLNNRIQKMFHLKRKVS